jgi:hypothetical protein
MSNCLNSNVIDYVAQAIRLICYRAISCCFTRGPQSSLKFRALGIVAFSSFVTGCTTVPPLSHATNNLPFTRSIPIHDVVQRIKCELADALDRKTSDPQFYWMAPWTVKADLTLQANETGGITPTAAFVAPLKNAFNLDSGPSSASFPKGIPGTTTSATQQNFTFGFGASYSGQVYRTETLSFSLSLAELKAWRTGPAAGLDCRPSGINDLQGDLDLVAWVNSALDPIAAGDLSLGIHPSPGGGAPPNARTSSRASTEEIPVHPTEGQLAYYKAVAADSAKAATSSAEAANASSRQASSIPFLSERVRRKISALANRVAHDAIQAQQASKSFEDPTPSKEDPNPRKRTPDNFILATIQEDARTAAMNAEDAARLTDYIKILTSPDPPIDSLSHSLNFIVTIAGGVSPSWTLLNWKGPANIGSLASYSGIRTHTLTIVLGSPAPQPNTEAARVLNNQAFRQAIQSP